MKRRLILASLIILIACVGAIHELPAGDALARQIEPVTLHLASDGPPGSFDPLDAVQHAETINQLYLGLTRLDGETGTIQPALASAWEVSADGLIWRFTLRDDVPWALRTVASGSAR